MNAYFWQGKKVIVTGHTGFKGAWLSLWLQHLGAEVVGFSLDPPSDRNLFEVADVSRDMLDRRGDVRDLKCLIQCMEQHAPDVVFHLAAQALVRPSYTTPVETYATNVMGTVNVLESIRHCPSVKSAVFVTTDKCYENRESLRGYREEDPMGGHDPYSSSKGCAELVVSAYRRSFFESSSSAVNVATVRAGNVIGGGDWATDRLVPDMISGLVERNAFVIRNPAAIRPWQHVLEPLRGYLMLAERLHGESRKWSQAWNFGPSQEDAQPVSVVADLMVELWGDGHWTTDEKPGAVHEARLLQLDCSKARHELKWTPRFDLRDALQCTVEWYRAATEKEDMRDFTLQQIVEYQVRANITTPARGKAA